VEFIPQTVFPVGFLLLFSPVSIGFFRYPSTVSWSLSLEVLKESNAILTPLEFQAVCSPADRCTSLPLVATPCSYLSSALSLFRCKRPPRTTDCLSLQPVRPFLLKSVLLLADTFPFLLSQVREQQTAPLFFSSPCFFYLSFPVVRSI